MSGFRFASIPSNASVAAAVTLAVSTWFAVAAGTILAGGTDRTDRTVAQRTEGPQHAVLMEEAAPASPTPIPVADLGARVQPVADLRAAVQPVVCEKIVVEAQRIRVS